MISRFIKLFYRKIGNTNVSDLPQELPSMLEEGDLVLLLGAGNIGHIAQEIREKGFSQEAAA